MSAIAIRSLSKIYKARGKSGPKTALDSIDLTVEAGSMFALLGPNGAGKSTLINILAGLVTKSAGSVAINGIDIDADTRAARRAIGIVPQELNLDPFFSPRALLDLQAGLYGVPKAERRTEQLLSAVGLLDKANSPARALSGGMRRRLMVAKAMVHAPKILVLDEPTAGVDIELRQSLWSYVRELNAAGTTVLLTTHYLEEAETLCDTVAIIDRGKVVTSEPKAKLMKRLDSKTLVIETASDIGAVPPAVAALGFVQEGAHRLVLRYRPSDAPLPAVLSALHASGLPVADISTKETGLEEVFLSLTKRHAA